MRVSSSPIHRCWSAPAGRAVKIAILLSAFTTPCAHAAENLVERPLAARSGPRGATLLKVISTQESGLVAENRYADPKMWGERYNVFMMGASGTGVAIGDYDGDGRPDIFVVSKTESCRLFRNLGGWRFEDVTEKAGVGDKGNEAAVWKQGVAFADVNNDGLLDIYVCRFAAPNRLYVNQGDGTFKEEAAKRGLAMNDASVMAAFCDYDRDGWLDVFVQTNLLDAAQHPNGQRNRLFHNNGDGTFAETTEQAGITGEAQGHSATWWDYNNDGWPDLYVANDFAAADKLYRNNRNGTFTDVIHTVVPHLPYSSMGADLGDVNNDGLIDFLASDMAATSHVKDQRAVAFMRSAIQEPIGNSGLPQPMQNALFLNTGTERCLEAARLTGLAVTDWTWAPRFEDFDNDGKIDLLVTNGMVRETHNADLTTRKLAAESFAGRVQIERASPVLTEQHLAFRNLGGLCFEDVSAAWGLNLKGVSFGMATGDLDGDGDLDVVYANFQDGVTLLRNDSDSGHRLVVELKGTKSNRYGVGAVVRVETEAGVQVRPLVLARGLLSTSEPILHFGLGEQTRIKRLVVEWPNGLRQMFADLPVDRKFTVTEAAGEILAPTPAAPASQFAEIGDAANLAHLSREIVVDELAQQPLLPMRQNRRGPALAVGDLNGDGKDDVIIGGTPTDPAHLMFAGAGSKFSSADASGLATAWPLSDGPFLIFDANGDGASDLLVTKGGTALAANAPEYQPKLFFNDGRGGFRLAPAGAIPALPISAGVVVAADFDRDGRLDVFVGARVLPGQYPLTPRSALWANRGGRFEDVTDSLAPGLREVGMVTSALWSDVDGDGWVDLLVALEWGGVKFFRNNRGTRFEERSDKAGFTAAGTGWWNGIAAADFNGDGQLDYAIGNLGLNTPYRADPAHPVVLFASDFKGSGEMQLVEGYYEGENLYPRRTRRDLGASIPSILKKYPRNDNYARATLSEILGEDKLRAALRFAATELRAGVFLSQADRTFRFEPLPRLAQISPTQGIVAGDFDG
ncbi:MAG: FG-GAP-like repeat-containing protein, partial [Opitutaceae bacterium]